MEPADIAWVAGPGREVRLAAQADLPTLGPLSTVTRLRATYPDLAPAQISTACAVAGACISHADKLGASAQTLVLTDTLAQQATNPLVSGYRTQRMIAAGITSVIDATSGAGLDALALHNGGIAVTAIDMDAVTVECARANLPESIDVIHGDARAIAPELLATRTGSALFVDPARRDAAGPRRNDGSRAHAERDPERWSPPWSWVCHMAVLAPTVAKVAPGIPLSLVPRDATVEWISVGSEVVEACVWFPPLNDPASRRATVITKSGTIESIDNSQEATSAEIGSVGEFLLEPHDAVIRADLVDRLAAKCDATRITPSSTWLTGPSCVSALARTWEVLQVVPVGQLRESLRSFERVNYKTSDIDRSAQNLASSVGHRAGRDARGEAWVVMIRDATFAAIVRPA
jgi:hypothetical protein